MGNPLRYGLEIAGMFLAGTIYPDQKLLNARLKLQVAADSSIDRLVMTRSDSNAPDNSTGICPRKTKTQERWGDEAACLQSVPIDTSRVVRSVAHKGSLRDGIEDRSNFV